MSILQRSTSPIFGLLFLMICASSCVARKKASETPPVTDNASPNNPDAPSPTPGSPKDTATPTVTASPSPSALACSRQATSWNCDNFCDNLLLFVNNGCQIKVATSYEAGKIVDEMYNRYVANSQWEYAKSYCLDECAKSNATNGALSKMWRCIGESNASTCDQLKECSAKECL